MDLLTTHCWSIVYGEAMSGFGCSLFSQWYEIWIWGSTCVEFLKFDVPSLTISDSNTIFGECSTLLALW